MRSNGQFTIIGVVIALASVGALFSPAPLRGSTETQEQTPPLVFRIAVEPPGPREGTWLSVRWELENTSSSAVYVCQWPGPAFGSSWDMPDGTSQGHAPGYPHTRKLERKYFVALKPGEALIGQSRYLAFPTPSGKLSVWGEYRSGQAGDEFGLHAWQGRIDSNSVTVDVPTEAKPAPGEPKDRKM